MNGSPKVARFPQAAAAALFALAGIHWAPLCAQGDRRAAVIASDRSTSEIAWDKGMAAALDGALLDDAVLLWPGAPILQGKSQITRFFAAQPAAASAARFMWQAMHVELSQSESMALVWGVMVVNRPAADGVPAAHRIGRYLAVWRRLRSPSWRLAAFAPIGTLPATETAWADSLGPRELPGMLRTARGGPRPNGFVDWREFAVADSTFAAAARHGHAAAAFGTWAALDAVNFAGNGELNMGAARIRAAIAAGGDAEWQWEPVVAVSSGESYPGGHPIGYTIGQATITSRGADGKMELFKSKYMTFWKRMPDRTVRWIADGGNARP